MFRFAVLIAVFAVSLIAVVGLRVEQTRSLSNIHQLRMKQVEVRQSLDRENLKIARLRSPEQIHTRSQRMKLPLQSPLVKLREANSMTNTQLVRKP